MIGLPLPLTTSEPHPDQELKLMDLTLHGSSSIYAANSSNRGEFRAKEYVFVNSSRARFRCGRLSRVKSGLKKKLDVGVSSGDTKFKSASEEIKSGFTNISSGEVRAAEIERKAELQRLDALAAKRLNDEFEMSKQQRKRAAEVQQQAQYYTEEDWDLIRSRMEASTELRKSVFVSDIDAEDYAKKMVELVEKRRREIREQKLIGIKPSSPTSQSHGWIIPQLKKLSFEELNVQFERAIRSIENFIPMDSEKEKESLKRSGETLQGAEKKKQKGIGLHTSTEPESGEVDITSSKIVKWKILWNIGVNLYKIVLQKTTAYGPEEDLERAFAENLRIMFDPSQSEDTVWSLPMHIPIVNWRYYDSCAKGLTSPEQTATVNHGHAPFWCQRMNLAPELMVTGKVTSISIKIFTDITFKELNTPGSDENRLKLYDLMYI
ncbi:hypothetical protein Tco_0097520 [Tanacetum coccineum]